MSLVEEMGLVFVSTGSGKLLISGEVIGLGVTLFANTLLALDANTGKRTMALPNGEA